MSRTPLPPVAREARKLDLRGAMWLVQVAQKDAALSDLAALCRDQRVTVQTRAIQAMIAFLSLEPTAERLAEWYRWRWNTPREDGHRSIGSSDVPIDLKPEYDAARDRFVQLLTDQGVREADCLWRKHRHGFCVRVHMRASSAHEANKPA